MRKTIIALYLEMSLRQAFGGALLTPHHDMSLTMAFTPRNMGEFKIYSEIANTIPHQFNKSNPTGTTAFHQMNRPVRQPHCPSAANAVKKAKAAARDENRGLNNE